MECARQTTRQWQGGVGDETPPNGKVCHNRNSPQPDTGLRSGQEDEEHGKALCCRDRGAGVLTSSSQRNATICRYIAPQSRSSTPRVPPGHKHCAAGNKATSPKRTRVEHHQRACRAGLGEQPPHNVFPNPVPDSQQPPDTTPGITGLPQQRLSPQKHPGAPRTRSEMGSLLKKLHHNRHSEV